MVGCYVYGCDTGYHGKPGHSFKISRRATDETRAMWIKNIPKREDKVFNFKTCYICDRHFEKDKIIKTKQAVFEGAVIAEQKLQRWRLADDAYPTIFLNKKLPSYLCKTGVKFRKPPCRQSKYDNVHAFKSFPTDVVQSDIPEKENHDLELSEIFPKKKPFQDLLQEFELSNLPQNWTYEILNDELIFRKLRYSKLNDYEMFTVEMTASFGDSRLPICTVRGITVDIGTKENDAFNNWRNVLTSLEKLSLCSGVSNFNSIFKCDGGIRKGNEWFSQQCTTYATGFRCLPCDELKTKLFELGRKLFPVPSRVKLKKTIDKSAVQRNKAQKLRRISKRLVSQKEALKLMRVNLLKMKEDTLLNAINREDRLPEPMKMALVAAAKVAKAKSLKGRRYQSDWLLQCLLIKITSPKAYRFLRDNRILALPHPKHLSRLLQGIPCNFGFNDFAFQELGSQYSTKERRDRQFILVFDEMKVRESIDYDKISGQFTGFIDYDTFTDEYLSKTKKTSKLADHALVLMCRNLNSKVVQPIASFASNGAAPGHILAKIVMSCILKLEAVSCEVVGVVCDGASSNKSFWKLLGISGNPDNVVSSIKNPLDASREIHFFHDVPHVIKCIRNHLQKHKVGLFDGKLVNWGFFEALFDLDKRDDLKVAEKLTAAHINPGPFQKMVVCYATQIFSETVANGLRLLRDELKFNELKHSETTEEFTRCIDELFDILNAKLPKDGVRVNSSKLTKLEKFFEIISKPGNTFASKQTMDSLRVTIQSSIRLTKYLCNEVGFAYVLTAKFNQDCLERFFGILRSFGGSDSHPTVASFTHLFRILSMYTPVKTRLTGNITATEDEELSMYVNKLQNMKVERKQKRQELLQNNKNLLKSALYVDEDEPLQGPTADLKKSDCIVYHLCGFLASKSSKFTSCIECQLSMKSSESSLAAKVLTDIKSYGNLTYPSDKLYYLINYEIEPVVNSQLKDIKVLSGNFLQETLQRLPLVNVSGLGCSEQHTEEFVSEIILYYMTIRCYFHKREFNHTQLRCGLETKNKRKEANFK